MEKCGKHRKQQKTSETTENVGNNRKRRKQRKASETTENIGNNGKHRKQQKTSETSELELVEIWYMTVPNLSDLPSEPMVALGNHEAGAPKENNVPMTGPGKKSSKMRPGTTNTARCGCG